jgi:serine-type D-Ala-D-Ala carboxypeptidase (penicillin-binding protein 5/6)
MPRPSRPPLYSLERGRNRPRGLPRISVPRLVAMCAAAVALVVGGFLAWRLWPLTDTSAGVIPPSAVTGPSTVHTPGGSSPLPALFASQAVDHKLAVHADAALVVDAATGRVIWELHPHEKLPVASLTKLMTALVVMHSAPGLDRRFEVTRGMLGVPGYTIGLRAGQRVTVRQMLAATLVASANDAADVLAVHRSGSLRGFVRLMNRWAHRLRLADTRYSNPSGIYDAGNHSSAWDVAQLSRLFLRVPELRSIVRRRVYTTSPTTGYVSRNRLLWTYRGAIGIKTASTTAAGVCLAAAATRGKRTLIAVLLHAHGDAFAGAARLLDFGFRHD